MSLNDPNRKSHLTVIKLRELPCGGASMRRVKWPYGRQFIRQQTSVVNAIRAHHAEFGIVAPVGRHGVEQLLGVVADAGDTRLPKGARACVCRSWGATADAESSATWVTPLCGHSK
jgi:hypothetical protein